MENFKMVTLSAAELAEANDLDYTEATGLLKTLLKLGIAQSAGIRKISGSKGKGSNLYSLPLEIKFTLKEPKIKN
jgi:hypothetical protein